MVASGFSGVVFLTFSGQVGHYDDVAGIKHRIFPRNPDGQSLDEPLIVSIDLSEIAFT